MMKSALFAHRNDVADAYRIISDQFERLAMSITCAQNNTAVEYSTPFINCPTEPVEGPTYLLTWNDPNPHPNRRYDVWKNGVDLGPSFAQPANSFLLTGLTSGESCVIEVRCTDDNFATQKAPVATCTLTVQDTVVEGSYTGIACADIPSRMITMLPGPSSESANTAALDAAIASTPAGGYIVWPDGDYIYQVDSFNISKELHLLSENKHGACIKNKAGLPVNWASDNEELGTQIVFAAGADGSSVEGLCFENILEQAGSSVFGYTIRVLGANNVSIRHNRFNFAGDEAIGARNGVNGTLIEFNEFFDTYPAGFPNYNGEGIFNDTTGNWQGSLSPNSDSHTDYAIRADGVNTTIRFNYFHGSFHQTISVSERAGSVCNIIGNTFDGCALQGIIVGQAAACNAEVVNIRCNVFRPVVGADGEEYTTRYPIRISAMRNVVNVEDNVVEGAAVPIFIDCQNSNLPTVNCGSGTLNIRRNWLTSRATDSSGFTGTGSAHITQANTMTGLTVNVDDNAFINGTAANISSSHTFTNNSLINSTAGTGVNGGGNESCSFANPPHDLTISSVTGSGLKQITGANSPDFASMTVIPSLYGAACASPPANAGDCFNRNPPVCESAWCEAA